MCLKIQWQKILSLIIMHPGGISHVSNSSLVKNFTVLGSQQMICKWHVYVKGFVDDDDVGGVHIVLLFLEKDNVIL
jgi:hypothetical protein